MRRGVVVALAGVVALVVLVLLVRPGTRLPDQMTSPAPTTAPVPAPSVTLEPLPGLAELARTEPGDLAVDPGGVGPIRLGTDVAELVAAGWQRVQQVDGCTRVRGARLQGGELLGWAVDDRVVSLQLRDLGLGGTAAGDRPGATGRPLDDVEAQAPWAGDIVSAESVTVGQRQVRVVEWSDGLSSIVASDLGDDLVRQVEVATDAGLVCVHGPETVQPEFASYDALLDVGDLEELAAATDLLSEVDALGLTVQEAAQVGLDLSAALDGTVTVCRTVDGLDSRGRVITTYVDDGVVVGQRVGQEGAREIDLPVRVDGAWARVVPSTFSTGQIDGTSLVHDLVSQEQVLDVVDAGVLTGPPVVVSRLVGRTCEGS